MGFDIGGAGSGAMSGASTGMMFGPWGAAAGGVAGGLLGGFKGGEDKQKVEDFYGAAEKQGASSRPNTTNAMGGQTWTTGPDGRPVSSTNFTGQAADTFGALQGGMNAAANYDPTQARDAAISSNYNQAASRLDPQWQQRGQAFTSGMANQGLDPGTQAYDAAQGNESRAQNDAYTSAMANAVRQGNETQATQMAQMDQPFRQAGNMMGMLNQQAPNYGQATDYMGAAKATQQANNDAYDQGQAKQGGKKGGAGSLMGGMGGGKGG